MSQAPGSCQPLLAASGARARRPGGPCSRRPTATSPSAPWMALPWSWRPGVHGYTDSAEQCLAACRRPCVIGLTRQAAGPGLNSGAELSVPARLDNELLYARRPLIIALQRELWQGRQSTVFPDEHLLTDRALLLTEGVVMRNLSRICHDEDRSFLGCV